MASVHCSDALKGRQLLDGWERQADLLHDEQVPSAT